jgi:restriction system protein
MDITYHYPPDLMSLLVETVPLLFKSKKDVLLFFRGAGVADNLIQDLSTRVKEQKDSVNKYEITRTVLTRLNERGEASLRERREILKRVTEFEDYSTCWADDQLKAKGYVAEIRQLVNVKDTFTRIQIERDEERKKRQADHQAKVVATQQRQAEFDAMRTDLYALFGERNPHRRGKSLEGILARLFKASDILVREAFTLTGSGGEGVIEQIDGVVELDGQLYLVEAKWWESPLGPGEVGQHLTRLFARAEARGIFISASDYTAAAISTCREALRDKVVVLCQVKELVWLLDQERDLKEFLKEKTRAAIIDKNPYHEPLSQQR